MAPASFSLRATVASYGDTKFGQHPARGGERLARDGDHVLQPDRDAVERPPRAAGGAAPVGGARLRQGVRLVEGVEGPDRRLDRAWILAIRPASSSTAEISPASSRADSSATIGKKFGGHGVIPRPSAPRSCCRARGRRVAQRLLDRKAGLRDVVGPDVGHGKGVRRRLDAATRRPRSAAPCGRGRRPAGPRTAPSPRGSGRSGRGRATWSMSMSRPGACSFPDLVGVSSARSRPGSAGATAFTSSSVSVRSAARKTSEKARLLWPAGRPWPW